MYSSCVSLSAAKRAAMMYSYSLNGYTETRVSRLERNVSASGRVANETVEFLAKFFHEVPQKSNGCATRDFAGTLPAHFEPVLPRTSVFLLEWMAVLPTRAASLAKMLQAADRDLTKQGSMSIVKHRR